MDCPHCGKAFHDEWIIKSSEKFVPKRGYWYMFVTICPACENETVELQRYHAGHTGRMEPNNERRRVYPSSTFRKPTPHEVLSAVKTDYEEACQVLPISSKASAALSRRCLQAVLRDHGYRQKDLVQQIDALLNEPDPKKAIPTGLRDTVDAIRNFGNFSAHPMTDQTTLQIIDVEPHEAEWCLDILDEMFDHFYVKPAQAKARKEALNRKLKDAGKPPAK